MVLSILRSWAFFFPALDFAFFPMIKSISELSSLAYTSVGLCVHLSFWFATCGVMTVGDGGLIKRVLIIISLCFSLQLT